MYIVIKRRSLRELVLVINVKLQQGLTPLGGVICSNDESGTSFAQAMFLSENAHDSLQRNPGKYVHLTKELQNEFDSMSVYASNQKHFPTNSTIVIEPKSVLIKKTLIINRTTVNNICALHMCINIADLCS